MGEMLVEWKDHDKALSTKLWEFFNEEFLADFSVTCHGQQLKVHKFVLAFLFPLLKESFESTDTFSIENEEVAKDGSSKIQEVNCLNLDNIVDHPEDMNYLIHFAYTGKIIVPKEHANCLMHIADNMEIKSLKESLGRYSSQGKLINISEPKDVMHLRPQTQMNVIDKFVNLGSLSDVHDDDDDDDVKSNKSINLETKSLENLTRTDFKKETNVGTASNEETPTSANDTVQQKKSFKCPHCDFVAKIPSRLKRHLYIHSKTETLPFVCKFCNTDVGSSNMLNIHRDSKCGTEPLACKYCDYKTLNKQTLQQHVMAKHQVDTEGNPLEKNLKCPNCDFICYAKHQLRTHCLYKHERLNKFKCKECSYTAPYVNKLQKHERIVHQKRKDYMCEECGERFKTSGRLNRHVLIKHKGMKPHKCHICNVEYLDSFSFKMHMQRHEGKVDYKFVCHVCGHRLRKKFELRTHVKKKHGIELEEEPTGTDQCEVQNSSKPTS